MTFSNGDPYNAYVQWYSLYRSLLLIQGPQFILAQNFYSTNFSTTDPLSYFSSNASVQAANATLVADLNSWNFDNPTASEISQMEVVNQSFQVINNLTIALNLGYGYLDSNYTYLLASISAPNSYAVDPTWVDANGGVQVGQVNSYLASNTMGTGPYLLQNYNGVGGGGYTLSPNPHYWGAAAAKAGPWNINLPPANTTVDVIFQDAIDITTNDLTSGAVQEASFAYIGPSTIAQLMGHSNVDRSGPPDDLRGDQRVVVDLPQFERLPVQQPLRPGGDHPRDQLPADHPTGVRGVRPAVGRSRSARLPVQQQRDRRRTVLLVRPGVGPAGDREFSLREQRLRRDHDQLHVPQHGERLG